MNRYDFECLHPRCDLGVKWKCNVTCWEVGKEESWWAGERYLKHRRELSLFCSVSTGPFEKCNPLPLHSEHTGQIYRHLSLQVPIPSDTPGFWEVPQHWHCRFLFPGQFMHAAPSACLKNPHEYSTCNLQPFYFQVGISARYLLH